MINKQRGNALLIVIIFMALLSALVMSAYILVQRQIVQQRSFVHGEQSYYAAEAATELALMSMKGHLPGFEGNTTLTPMGHTPLRKTMGLPVSVQDSYHQFSIFNRASVLPVEANQPLTLIPQRPTSIPLFRDEAALTDENVQIEDFTDAFTFAYHTPPERPILSPQIPCVRWDISGFKKGTQETESIGDIIPCSKNKLDTSLNGFIGQFLKSHTQSYLTVTNLLSNGTILYGELTTQPSTSVVGRPMATIEASGRVCSTADSASCTSFQAIDTTLPQGQILPIFSYTIYQ